jgi:signal peptidase I
VTRPPRWLVEVVETLALTLVTFFVIQTFVAQPFQVRQTSMERTLEPDQYVLVDKLTPRFDPFHRGDIVVLHPPDGVEDDTGTPFIKRVIGLPGETVRINGDGSVTVSGLRLDETSYTYTDPDGANQPTTPQSDQAEWTLGPDELFVMGDHREASADSRSFGPIKESEIVGRAFLRYWPAGVFGILSRPSYPQPPSG